MPEDDADSEDLLLTPDEDTEGRCGSESIAKEHRSLDRVFFGAFRAVGYLGRGKGGGTVFAVDHPDCGRAAAKWPISAAEVDALQELCGHRSGVGCPGVPRLLARGKVENEWYMVTEALGRPLSAVCCRIRRYPLRHRWRVLSPLGCMLLRRLQAIHEKGYIHNDVKPDNILMGRVGAHGTERYLPYLVDYGTAQRFSGSDILRRDLGTVDFNSIRSGRDLQRRPHDDLEALAWTLLHGLFGELPWFHFTREVDWSDKTQRFKAVAEVQAMKEKFLKEGPYFLGSAWSHFEKIPQGLQTFLALCQPTRFLDDMPQYQRLAHALGSTRYGNPDQDFQEVRQLQQALREGEAHKLAEDYPDGEAEALREDLEREKAEREAVRGETARRADAERMNSMNTVWKVVGGEDRGGVLVRKGCDLSSPALASRLATGALVEEEELEGERLSYSRLIGDGPNCGWVSIRIKYGDVVKQLLVPHQLTTDEFELVKAEAFAMLNAAS